MPAMPTHVDMAGHSHTRKCCLQTNSVHDGQTANDVRCHSRVADRIAAPSELAGGPRPSNDSLNDHTVAGGAAPVALALPSWALNCFKSSFVLYYWLH